MTTVSPTHEETLAVLWHKFTAQFLTEQDCLEELYSRFDDLMKCHHCGSVEIEKSYGSRTAVCTQCHQISWLTAGTFFHGIRSARPWLAAIWLMEQGVIINSATFQRLVGKAYSTALTTNTKVRMVLSQLTPQENHTVSSAHFAPVISKRSRETPARRRPLSEQEEVDSRLNESNSDFECCPTELASTRPPLEGSSQRSFPQTNPQEKFAPASPCATDEISTLSLLSDGQRHLCQILSDQPVHFDNLHLLSGMSPASLLASLTVLELEGLVKCLPGGCYVRPPSLHADHQSMQPLSPVHSLSESVGKTIISVIEIISSIFGGISRKYLQLYLATHWCQAQAKQAPGWLVKECLRHGPITYAQILAYVTPPVVKLSLVPHW